MPAVPNFLNNPMTPLGQAFSNLTNVLAARPSDAQRQTEADTLVANQRKLQGQKSLADMLSGMSTAQPPAPQAPVSTYSSGAGYAPPPAAPAVNPATVFNMPGGTSLQIDPAKAAAAALFAGIDPKVLGGYEQNVLANQFGARDDRTTNATVGAGEPYSSTAQSFDINQQNDLTKAAATNATSRANNADTNATSKANAQLHEQGENDRAAQNGTDTLDPATIKYLADQVRNGAPLPALGMGKQAAAMRGAILRQAASDDEAAGRTGTDAAVAKQDYAGNMAGSRTLGTREANIGTAVHGLENAIPLAKAQFDQVARTGLYPMDAILNAIQHGTNDPALAKLAVSVNDVVNLHAKAMNQGLITDQGRAQSLALLSQVNDAKYAGAALDQMLVGAQRELKAPGQTRQDLHDAQRGALGGKPDAGAPAASGGHEQWVRDPKTGKLQKAQ